MSPADRTNFLLSGLKAGVLSAEQQAELFVWFDARDIEFKVMRTTLDEIYQNEREQDELDRAARLPTARIYKFPERPVFAADHAS